MKKMITISLIALCATIGLTGCFGGPIMLGEAVDDFVYDWIPGDAAPTFNLPSSETDPEVANSSFADTVHRVTVTDGDPMCALDECTRNHRQDQAFQRLSSGGHDN